MLRLLKEETVDLGSIAVYLIALPLNVETSFKISHGDAKGERLIVMYPYSISGTGLLTLSLEVGASP
jgi:hypothetical protein